MTNEGKAEPKKEYDPVYAARMPTSLIDAVRAKAAERRVAASVIIREALRAYVGEDRAA